MNSQYQGVYKTADYLRHHFRDVVDEPNDPEARTLYAGLDNFAEHLEMEKSARSLEEEARRLAEEFRRVGSRPVTFMDPRHLNDFRTQLEHIVQSVRKFDNY